MRFATAAFLAATVLAVLVGLTLAALANAAYDGDPPALVGGLIGATMGLVIGLANHRIRRASSARRRRPPPGR